MDRPARARRVDRSDRSVPKYVKNALQSIVIEYWMSEPQRTLEAQSLLLSSYMGIWLNTLQRIATGQQMAEPD